MSRLRAVGQALQRIIIGIGFRPLRASVLQFLLALILSLALWTFISFTENPTRQGELEVDVAVNEPSPGLVPVNPTTGLPGLSDATTTVRVVGPRDDVAQLSADQFEASADISNLPAGLHIVPIHVEPPPEVRLLSYQPKDVTVRLEPVGTKTMTVTQEVVGQPPFSYTYDVVSIASDEVVVRGPQDLVERVEQVVARIDLQGRTSNFTEPIPLEPLDDNGDSVPGVTPIPQETNVSVRISPTITTQRVSVLPQFEGEPAQGYVVERYDWNPKFVEVGVTPGAGGATTLRTEPIDLSGRTESFTETVQLIDQEGVFTQLPTDNVMVSVDIIPFAEVQSNIPLSVPVTPVNLDPRLQATAKPPSLDITVSGTFQQLRQLANTTVQATVNLRDLGPGTYTLPVTIDLPKGLEIVGPEPQVTVTITQSAPEPTVTVTPRGG
jgi:YbbR domain-containing protein